MIGDDLLENQAMWAVLHHAFGTGANRQLLLLLEKEPKVEELWGLSKQGWMALLPGLKEEIAGRLEKTVAESNWEHTKKYMEKREIRMVQYYDGDYPESLRNIDNPPPFLYLRGNAQWNKLCIGVVGSRKCSEYGKRVAFDLGRDLSMNDICVISGLARGIDGAAHSGALEGAGGTIGVLGCGIDVVYPRENTALYESMLNHPLGMIMSEFPLGAKPLNYHFPMRNRIISGLCQGLVVVEASLKSGALITAELALEQGKDVFAVPGNIYAQEASGCIRLLKDGAKLVSEVSDVLEEYGTLCEGNKLHKKVEKEITADLSGEERKVLDLVTVEPIGVDEIGYLAKMPVQQLMSILSVLEIEGLVKSVAGRKYMRIG